jgi:hypothetical protein
MRFHDAGLHCHKTKLVYPNHRSPPWLTEATARDRSIRLLEEFVPLAPEYNMGGFLRRKALNSDACHFHTFLSIDA